MPGRYWAQISISPGSSMRAYVDAGSAYEARQMFESMYGGDRMITNPTPDDGYSSGPDMYWTTVSIEPGSVMRVYVQARNPYEAGEMFRSLYGSRVIGLPVRC